MRQRVIEPANDAHDETPSERGSARPPASLAAAGYISARREPAARRAMTLPALAGSRAARLREVLFKPLRAYDHLLKTRPLPTKVVTGLVCSGAGDVAAQAVTRGENTNEAGEWFSWRRLSTFALFGALWTGPVNHVWLRNLNGAFPGKTMTATLQKVGVQQLIFNPFAFMPCFFAAYGVGMGLSQEALEAKVKKDYWSSLVACWQIWSPVGLVVFRMPERFQSVTFAGINFLWNMRLSLLVGAKAEKDALLTDSEAEKSPVASLEPIQKLGSSDA